MTVRCFQSGARDGLHQYDIRYSINVPLLTRLVPEIEKAGSIEFIISIDGTPVGAIPTRIIAQNESINFLTKVEPDLIDKLEAAKKTIVVMPRQRHKNLDDIIEFKVAKLAENIKPVKEACKSVHNRREPPAEQPIQAIKKT